MRGVGWGIPQKSDRAVELQTRQSEINSQNRGHGSSIGYPPPFLATLGSGITHGAADDHPLRMYLYLNQAVQSVHTPYQEGCVISIRQICVVHPLAQTVLYTWICPVILCNP